MQVDMSEEYKQFSKETYGSIYQEIKHGLSEAGNLPVLVVSGEMHREPLGQETLNTFIPDEYEEPALAGSYSHISAIQAAADLVGKENVVISIEADDAILKREIDAVETIAGHRSNGDIGRMDPESARLFDNYTMFHAIEYANTEGFRIVASDPNRENWNGPERFSGEIESLGKLALDTSDNRPKIVVHLGGSSHFATLQGNRYMEDKAGYEGMTSDEAISPFEGIYGKSIFINSEQPISDMYNRSDADYSRNPKNALQIDPPGRMDRSDLEDMGSRIKEASVQMRESLSIPERSNSSDLEFKLD